jgi:hypothetical protein
MANKLQAFSAGFNRSAQKDDPFGDSQKAQLDALQTIVDDINAEGTFTAEIRLLLKETPVLDIKHKSDNLGQTFFIEFGHDAFGGSATLKLTTGMARAPLADKKDGFCIQYEPGFCIQSERDRTPFLKALGEEVGRNRDRLRVMAGAAAYVTAKKPAATP